MLFFETGYLTDLGLTILATLAVQQSPEICLSPPLPISVWDYKLMVPWLPSYWLLGTQTQTPRLPQQVLYPLNHLPSPDSSGLKTHLSYCSFPEIRVLLCGLACHILLTSSLSILEAQR